MKIVEALILAAGQGQDQLLLGNRQGPRHGASAIAMLHPAHGIGPIAALEALHLAFTQLQQTGGFAYAQPPACCILNHFHPLELFLTHRHHPYRVTKSRCSYGVTLSWSIYTECLGPSASGREPLEWKIFPGSLTLMRFPFGVQMTVVRAGRLLAALGVILAGSGCGDTYRPIAIPIQPIPPTPAALHYVVSLSMNGVCPPQAGEACGRGASTRIDVSGDTSVGAAQVGLNPVHAVITPNGS